MKIILTWELARDAAHAGPYGTEIAEGVANSGYVDSQVYHPTDFDGQPNGVYFVFMNVPDPGTTGSSPDFASGPIISNDLFPISVSAEFLHNGDVIANDSFDVPLLDDALNPPFDVDGHSHFPLFFG